MILMTFRVRVFGVCFVCVVCAVCAVCALCVVCVVFVVCVVCVSLSRSLSTYFPLSFSLLSPSGVWEALGFSQGPPFLSSAQRLRRSRQHRAFWVSAFKGVLCVSCVLCVPCVPRVSCVSCLSCVSRVPLSRSGREWGDNGENGGRMGRE